MRRLVAAAAFVLGVALLPAHAVACPMLVETASDSGARDEAGAAALPVELVRAPEEASDPLRRARDYGRLLILLSVPAAFVGLQLHLARRGRILPPT